LSPAGAAAGSDAGTASGPEAAGAAPAPAGIWEKAPWQPLGSSLPVTGLGLGGVLALGAGLVGSGLALRRWRGRRTRTP
ncbi:MAG: hypothetical protein ACRDT6_16975, partial [Micromonosporaceae bacterium]